VFGPTFPAPCVGAGSRYALLESWPRPEAVPPDGTHRCLVDLAATPDPISPFAWRLVARTSNSYETFSVDLLDRRYHEPASDTEVLWRRALRYPNVWTPAVFAAARAPATRLFLGFSRFPLVRTLTTPDGTTTVRWSDMRFAASGPVQGRGGDRGIAASAGNLFGVTDTVSADGRVIQEQFGR
jgi:hypothetical protein